MTDDVLPEERRPVSIDADRAAGTLHIVWQDGHTSLYDLATLRPLCPCAFCHGEMGRPGAVTPATVFTTGETTLADLKPVGRYAIQLIWSNGHDTGFYTFTLLRQACPCSTCRERWAR